MDRSDMLKMLGLDDALPAPGAATPTAAPRRTLTGPGATASAMKTDRWTERRGNDLRSERPDPDDGVSAVDMADFHTALFDRKPELLGGCTDGRKYAYMAGLLDSPEYKSLRTRTVHDATATAAAAQSLGDAWATLKARKPSMPDPSLTRPKDDRRTSDKMGYDTPSSRRIAEAKAKKERDAELEEETAIDAAVFEALDEASDELDLIDDSVGGCGMGPGLPGGKPDPVRINRIYQRIRKSAVLRDIMERAGRLRMVAQSKQRQKTDHGMDDMVGITCGGDIGRLISSELIKLVVPETELDALVRLVERRSLVREYHGINPVGLGPIISGCDVSGSMKGRKCHEAKALCLTQAWIARKQGRWCGLIAFSGDTDHRLLALPPTGWDEEKLLDWLEWFPGGGSCLDIPIREMPEFYEQLGAPKGKTDLFYTTDAQCHPHQYDIDAFNAWKKTAKARLTTLVLGTDGGDLSSISDEVYTLPAIEPGGDAVARVLSI